MKVNENENRIVVDVDDTLILYPYDLTRDSALAFGCKEFTDVYTGESFLALPSKEHIKLIKYYKSRGFYIMVHSGNGFKHAESIVKQLGIEEFIDEVCTKSIRYVDDLPCNEWMGGRIYLEKAPWT